MIGARERQEQHEINGEKGEGKMDRFYERIVVIVSKCKRSIDESEKSYILILVLNLVGLEHTWNPHRRFPLLLGFLLRF